MNHEELITELLRKNYAKVLCFRPKAYSFLIDGYSDDDYEKNKINKKAKGTKKMYSKERAYV